MTLRQNPFRIWQLLGRKQVRSRIFHRSNLSAVNNRRSPWYFEHWKHVVLGWFLRESDFLVAAATLACTGFDVATAIVGGMD